MKYFLAILSLAISFLLVAFAYVGENGKPYIEALDSEYNRLYSKTEILRTENEHLKEQIQAYKEDYSTIERAAREQLGMVKQQEIILQFDR